MLLEALPKPRHHFFVLRLALTALFLLLLAGVIRFSWYPGLLLELSGISRQLLVMAVAALVIGPGLSTLLYRPAKKGLLLDLVVVLIIEVAVIAVVAIDLYERRPFFAVFVVDRFELVASNEVQWGDIRYDELKSKPTGSPRLVYGKVPEDGAALSALIDETVVEGRADIERRPEFWLPYADGGKSVKKSLVPLEHAIAGISAPIVRAWLDGVGRSAADFGYLPIRGQAADAAMVIERASTEPVAILDFDPW